MNSETYKIDDEVKVIAKGWTYDYYDAFVTAYNIPCWQAGLAPKVGDIGRITSINKHIDQKDYTIYGVYFKIYNKNILMDKEGFILNKDIKRVYRIARFMAGILEEIK